MVKRMGTFDKIVFLVFSISSVAVVILSQYATAILLMLLMLILFFVLSYVKDRRKIFIVVVLLPAIYYLVLKLLGWVANSSYYEESILGYRLREVVQIMSGIFSEASDFT